MNTFNDRDNIRICYEGEKIIVKNNETPLLVLTNGEVHLINEDLVVVSRDAINIYQNIKQGLLSTSIISKQGIVLAKPIFYNEVIIVVFKDGIVQFDTNLNIIKRLFCDMDGIITKEQLVDKFFIFVLNKDAMEEKIIYDIENNILKRERLNCDIMLLRS